MKAMRIVSAAASLLLTTTVVAQQKPSELLSLFFHNHLDRILSPIGQPKPVPLPRARVTQLREQFADQISKAPDTDKPMYQAAVAVCDAVSAAMDERQKAIASCRAPLPYMDRQTSVPIEKTFPRAGPGRTRS